MHFTGIIFYAEKGGVRKKVRISILDEECNTNVFPIFMEEEIEV